jgi:hypothetical protein
MPEESIKPQPKRENLLVNLLFNVAIPSLLLMKGAKWLGMPAWAILCLSLAFPILYFLFDLKSRGRRNIVSIIGFVSILITGGVGLMHLPAELIAIKEAVVPSLFGLAIIGSMWTKHPLIKEFLLNPDFFDVERIEKAVAEHDAQRAFEKVMQQGTLLLSLSFFVSAALNYMLARWLIHSPSGTDAFNVEIGKLHMISYPAVALPATIIGMIGLWHVVSGIRTHTGLKLEEIMLNPDGPAEPGRDASGE